MGELRAALEGLDDEALIRWAYDGPQECCDGHVHDITEIHDCDAYLHAAPSGLDVMLTGGTP